MRVKHLSVLLLAALAAVVYGFRESHRPPAPTSPEIRVVALAFPSERYPETARHIQNAIRAGQPQVCTIDRKDADEHRKESLQDVPAKKGYDRDEWPMAMCAEGGSGANIAYIHPADNRGAGSWVSHQLDDYPEGTKVKFVVK
ncbi:NucA/NucB deoxyribonuclease domain-containing protein [Paenibacillus humicola]|uniref:NucA/NucB deoxyribonuclease domain-containing protein n=1 Tax=Paenibacillus humicola TaxID=3110540 RepID=UPI00237A8B93|nr:NucA/NucB deoxyribonuclease domain-containing protein [Paenibacillus humicola]